MQPIEDPRDPPPIEVNPLGSQRLDDFQVGSRTPYPLAYGKHLIAGMLAEHIVDKTTATTQDVYAKVLLGLGEWESMEELTYSGRKIDPSAFTFHRGTLSTGAADPVQGADVRFNNSIYHNRIAYYTVKIPTDFSNEDRPDKLRAICKCLKVNDYNSSGNIIGYGYSTNPARVFVDIVKRYTEQLSLPLTDFVDWTAFVAARNWYDGTLPRPDDSSIPKDFRKTLIGINGSLQYGTYTFRVQALDGSDQSDLTFPLTEYLGNANNVNSISLVCNAVSGATGYRWWIKHINSSTEYFQTTTSPTITMTTLGAVGTASGATGRFIVERPRAECHRAFVGNTTIYDMLNAVMFDAASYWVRDGKKFRIVTPNETMDSVHTLTTDNTSSMEFWRLHRAEKPNRVTVKRRDLMRQFLNPAEPLSVNREDAQSVLGLKEVEITMGSAFANQSARVANWYIRREFDADERGESVADGTSSHVICGSIISFTDAHANWTDKKFLVYEMEEHDSESPDSRTLSLREYYDTFYSDSDVAPIVSTQPTSIPSRYGTPQPIYDLDLSVEATRRDDGTANFDILGSVSFAPFLVSQIGQVYHRLAGASVWSHIQTLSPDSTNFAGFRFSQAGVGTHEFKVLVTSVIGVPQSTDPDIYSVDVDHSDLPTIANPTGYSLAFNGTELVSTWTNPNGYPVDFEIASDSGFTSIIHRGRSTNRYAEIPSYASRSLTRYLRLRDGFGNVSSSVSANLTISAPISPTVEPLKNLWQPNIGRFQVTSASTPASQVVSTLVQVRYLPDGTFPLDTNSSTVGNMRVEGMPSEVHVVGRPTETIELRIAHEDRFSTPIDDRNWTNRYHYFHRFGIRRDVGRLDDKSLDSTSHLSRIIAAKNHAPISGGGNVRWSRGEVSGESIVFDSFGSGISDDGITISRTSGSGFNSGAVSVEQKVSGRVKLNVSVDSISGSTGAVIGWSDIPAKGFATSNYEFGVLILPDELQLISHGSTLHTETVEILSGDLITLERPSSGGVVTMSLNGEELFTSSGTSSGDVYAKVTLSDTLCILSDLTVTGTIGVDDNLKWSDSFVVSPIDSALIPNGIITIDAPSDGLLLSDWGAVIARVTSSNRVSVTFTPAEEAEQTVIENNVFRPVVSATSAILLDEDGSPIHDEDDIEIDEE